MNEQKRAYRKRRRAALEAQTRLRITESTVELHGTLGPSRTSISAVADRAGVRRSTVYRHFPDEAALFAACSAHWTASNPLPDLAGWAAIESPEKRLGRALEELYTYYRRTQQMMENLHRDEATMPTVKQLFGGFRDYLAAARETLTNGRQTPRETDQTLRAAIGHALAFSTWRSLTQEQELDDDKAANLMCQLVTAAAPSTRHRQRRQRQERSPTVVGDADR
jgi:AcrR family transcriptional regulator